MNRDEDLKRMKELFEPIDKTIMMCDNVNDLLMMASCMMVTAKSIYDNHLGIENRKKMFKDLT
ncbi:hypothetical protein EB118_16430 [bacterium]|nr:hypothetical protein [bacterium]